MRQFFLSLLVLFVFLVGGSPQGIVIAGPSQDKVNIELTDPVNHVSLQEYIELVWSLNDELKERRSALQLSKESLSYDDGFFDPLFMLDIYKQRLRNAYVWQTDVAVDTDVFGQTIGIRQRLENGGTFDTEFSNATYETPQVTHVSRLGFQYNQPIFNKQPRSFVMKVNEKKLQIEKWEYVRFAESLLYDAITTYFEVYLNQKNSEYHQLAYQLARQQLSMNTTDLDDAISVKESKRQFLAAENRHALDLDAALRYYQLPENTASSVVFVDDTFLGLAGGIGQFMELYPFESHIVAFNADLKTWSLMEEISILNLSYFDLKNKADLSLNAGLDFYSADNSANYFYSEPSYTIGFTALEPVFGKKETWQQKKERWFFDQNKRLKSRLEDQLKRDLYVSWTSLKVQKSKYENRYAAYQLTEQKIDIPELEYEKMLVGAEIAYYEDLFALLRNFYHFAKLKGHLAGYFIENPYEAIELDDPYPEIFPLAMIKSPPEPPEREVVDVPVFYSPPKKSELVYWFYVVKPGDTVYTFTRRITGDPKNWPLIAQANKLMTYNRIEQDNRGLVHYADIYPGDVLRIPQNLTISQEGRVFLENEGATLIEYQYNQGSSRQ